ncbi:hypothetical protein IEI94_07020 [Halomonas sp. ML-15]|uniref:hypothetical protein n=1 Tax=Halomonas sp. ML-15 TaxID=2773305 RepID=UPI0017465C93|nr:hypothetical protein [Halomonas sp. ML-15]MBD3895601.1 hypothetical protein [Halomonas sp. ML-15]
MIKTKAMKMTMLFALLTSVITGCDQHLDVSFTRPVEDRTLAIAQVEEVLAENGYAFTLDWSRNGNLRINFDEELPEGERRVSIAKFMKEKLATTDRPRLEIIDQYSGGTILSLVQRPESRESDDRTEALLDWRNAEAGLFKMTDMHYHLSSGQRIEVEKICGVKVDVSFQSFSDLIASIVERDLNQRGSTLSARNFDGDFIHRFFVVPPKTIYLATSIVGSTLRSIPDEASSPLLSEQVSTQEACLSQINDRTESDLHGLLPNRAAHNNIKDIRPRW